MPRLRNASDWERGLRASVRSSTATGWSVREDKGRVRLEVRTERLNGSTTLPFDWSRRNVGDVVSRARNIYTLVTDGHDIRDAAKIANNLAPQEEVQWDRAIEAFRQKKTTTGLEIKEKTWNEDYRPYLEFSAASMQATKAPRNSVELAQKVLREWKDRPRSSEKALIAIKAFLDFSINNYGLSSRSWSLTREQLKEIRGRPQAARELAILEDTEITQLAQEVGLTRNGEGWKNYVALASTYGLRREEPWLCTAKKHPKHGFQMWCRNEKISGAYRTQPRWLFPLAPEGATWDDLVEAMLTERLALPDTRPGAWNTLLSKLEYWRELVKKYTDQGQHLKPGAIRDSYSYRAHKEGIAVHRICKAMGHSLITHQKHYVWATEDSVFEG